MMMMMMMMMMLMVHERLGRGDYWLRWRKSLFLKDLISLSIGTFSLVIG